MRWKLPGRWGREGGAGKPETSTMGMAQPRQEGLSFAKKLVCCSGMTKPGVHRERNAGRPCAVNLELCHTTLLAWAGMRG